MASVALSYFFKFFCVYFHFTCTFSHHRSFFMQGCPVNHKEFVVYDNRRALVEGIITFTVEQKEKKAKKKPEPVEEKEEDLDNFNNLDGSKIYTFFIHQMSTINSITLRLICLSNSFNSCFKHKTSPTCQARIHTTVHFTPLLYVQGQKKKIILLEKNAHLTASCNYI